MNFRGETVRTAFVDDGIAEICFDRQKGSVNKFDRLTLRELRQALDGLADHDTIEGLMLTSSKNVFVVGADITEFADWFASTQEQLIDDLLQIHATFSAIEDLPFPTVAVINGFALGGGFEVCLACDYRVMATDASVGLPEVRLGLFPGWGGTVRLPRLIGTDNALEWIGVGKHHRPAAALKQGAVDAAVAPEHLRESAMHLLRQCMQGKLDYAARRREKISPLKLGDVERTMAFETAKAYVAAKVGPHYPAPMIALECVEKHAPMHREQASRVEAEAFAKVARTDAAHNLVGLFLNDQALGQLAKRYAKDAKPISKAAVLGAGIMGGGIAYQTALKGIPIIMKDINDAAIDAGLSEARKLLVKRVERGRMKIDQMADVLNRINPTLTYGDVENAQIVVEAVVENEKVKKTVLGELESVLCDEAIMASNTSTISITSLARALDHPERFCGMHFFNPVHIMPLVEVIRGEESSAQAIATTVTFAKAIGKNPIVVNDCPGFLVNRILFPYLNAFSALVRDGADFQRIDQAMERFGWPMGPAYLLDVIGLDTACHAGDILAEGYPDRMRNDYTTAIEALHETGLLGQKSGRGFYRYELDAKGRPNKQRDESVYELIKPLQAGNGQFTDDQIVERMMVPMCLETVRCLKDGIVESAVVADMGLIWGIGFPPFRGGALRYVDSIGVARFCEIADNYSALGMSYRPPDRLREMAENAETFFGTGE